MDTVSIVVGVVLLSLFVVPFIAMHFNSKKREEEIAKLCREYGMQEFDMDEFNDLTMLTDTNSKKALFCRKTGRVAQTTCLNLNEVNKIDVTGNETEGFGITATLKSGDKKSISLSKKDQGVYIHEEAKVAGDRMRRRLNDIIN